MGSRRTARPVTTTAAAAGDNSPAHRRYLAAAFLGPLARPSVSVSARTQKVVGSARSLLPANRPVVLLWLDASDLLERRLFRPPRGSTTCDRVGSTSPSSA